MSVPDVVDVPAKSFGNSTLSCNVGSTRMSLHWSEIQEMFGRIRFKQY